MLIFYEWFTIPDHCLENLSTQRDRKGTLVGKIIKEMKLTHGPLHAGYTTSQIWDYDLSIIWWKLTTQLLNTLKIFALGHDILKILNCKLKPKQLQNMRPLSALLNKDDIGKKNILRFISF